MNYNNYPAIGIDAKIQLIQNQLFAHLKWNNVDFYGRVQKTVKKDFDGYIPEVYISQKDRKEVFYDDVKAAGGNVFFITSDEDTTNNGIQFTSRVKIVFMLNILKIKSTTTFRPDSEYQEIALKLINKLKMIEVTGIERGIENVLSDFNIKGIELNDMNPYHIFSLNGNLNYLFNCKNL